MIAFQGEPGIFRWTITAKYHFRGMSRRMRVFCGSEKRSDGKSSDARFRMSSMIAFDSYQVESAEFKPARANKGTDELEKAV